MAGMIATIVAAMAIGYAWTNFETDDQRAERASVQAAAEEQNRKNAEAKAAADAQCGEDLQCAGQRVSAKAERHCRPLLDDRAKGIAGWDYKVGDGNGGEVLLTKLEWADEGRTAIRFYGDNIKFQNGFGAWARHAYSCEFDLGRETAVVVKIY